MYMPKNVTSGGKGLNGTRGRSGSRGRSSSKGRSGSKDRNASRNRLRPLTVGFPLNSVRAKPSLTYNNFSDEQYYEQALVRTPGGTVIANYHNHGPPSPGYLPRYPSSSPGSSAGSSHNSNLSDPNSEEMLAAGAGHAGRFNRVYPAVRTRTVNRPDYNVGAYRRGLPPLTRRRTH
jgi:hypothetical protein